MRNSSLRQFTHDEYNVAIICPLEIEMSAVRYMLDEEHENLENKEGDPNYYIYGSLNRQNVVIGYLPYGSQGVGAAAAVATHMKRTFPQINLRLLVGVGGGVPNDHNDIRLGDVVVGMPSNNHGGIVQYDIGKHTAHGFERTGSLEPPNSLWRNCVVKMQSDHRVRDNRISSFISEMIAKHSGLSSYQRPAMDTDELFRSSYAHAPGKTTCQFCDPQKKVVRPVRKKGTPSIFYGLIASGNQVVKNAEVRDKLAMDAGGALCFEMEAAGLMYGFQSITIRGISDYADTHKNDVWQAYAAAVAAGYAKELLSYMQSTDGLSYKSQGHETSSRHVSSYENVVPQLDFNKIVDADRNEHWTILQPVNPWFTGRTEIVESISQTIQDAMRQPSTSAQCRIVITGMGGQGKSELSLRIANKLRKSFWGVFWVDVNTTTSAENSFLAIAYRLGHSMSDIEDVLQLLANHKEPWLLILDNADDNQVDYQKYFPPGLNGFIILTSRNRECHVYTDKNAYPLDGLVSADAGELLLKAAGIADNMRSTVSDDAENIATTILRGHPLALIQAGAYIARRHCTLKEYPQVFDQQRQRLLTFRPSQAQSRYGNVYATFEASAIFLQSSSDEAAKDALDLLRILSMLDSTQLQLSFFKFVKVGARKILKRFVDGYSGHQNVDDVHPWHVSHLPLFLEVQNEAWDPFRLVEAVHLLEVYSLLAVTGEGDDRSIVMHPLTNAWARDRQDSKQLQQSWLVVACMFAVYRYKYSFTSPREQIMRPHLPVFWSNTPTDLSGLGPQLEIARILLRCAYVLNDLRLDQEYLAFTMKAISHLNLDIDTVDEQYVILYHTLAKSFTKLGRTVEGARLLEHVVDINMRTQAKDDDRTLEAQQALAYVYRKSGRIRQAIELLEHIHEVYERKLPEDHVDLLDVQHELGRAYSRAGRRDKAIEMLERIVKVEETIDKDDLDRLTTQAVLGQLYDDDGRRDEAIALMLYVAEARKRVLAKDHPSYLLSLQDLAVAYHHSGQTKKALGLLTQVTEAHERTLSEDHPQRSRAVVELAVMYREDRQLRKSAKLLEQVVDVQKRTLSEDNAERISSQYELGITYRKLRWMDKSITALEEAVEARKRILPEDSYLLMASQHELALSYRRAKQPEKALELLEHLVKVEKDLVDRDPRSKLTSVHELAVTYRKVNKHEQAAQIMEDVFEKRQKILRKDDRDILASKYDLADVYWDLGRHDEALKLMHEALAGYKRSFSEDFPTRLDAEDWLESKEGSPTEERSLYESSSPAEDDNQVPLEQHTEQPEHSNNSLPKPQALSPAVAPSTPAMPNQHQDPSQAQPAIQVQLSPALTPEPAKPDQNLVHTPVSPATPPPISLPTRTEKTPSKFRQAFHRIIPSRSPSDRR